jgi:hypothetical protein
MISSTSIPTTTKGLYFLPSFLSDFHSLIILLPSFSLMWILRNPVEGLDMYFCISVDELDKKQVPFILLSTSSLSLCSFIFPPSLLHL